MNQLANRNQLAELLTELKLTGQAAFVGVAEAQFEFYFLDRWPGRASFIDPWRILDAPGFSGHGEDTDAGQEARYQRIIRTAQKPQYQNRVKLIRATSAEAVKRFADGSLDFVYIDADHSYQGISADLSLWASKLKPGAIFSGHDFLEGVHNGQSYGVKQAVTQFANHYNLTLNVTPEEWPTWYFQMPNLVEA